MINLVPILLNNIKLLIYLLYKCVFIILGVYYCPDSKEYDQFIQYIQGLPLVTKPHILGLHKNAALFKERQESELLLNSVLNLQVGKITLQIFCGNLYIFMCH